jgi:mono/diheme cytochrome c family protein
MGLYLKILKRSILFGGLVLSSLLQQSYAAETNSNGAKVWRNNCAICHGADGRGAPKMKQEYQGELIDFSAPSVAISLTRMQMLLAVRDGVKDGAMPSFRDTLNYQDIIDVVDYARQAFVLTAQTGDEHKAGEEIFHKRCSVCHGDQGQSAVWTAAGLHPKPANFTDPKKIAELDRTRMIFSVTNGRPETAMVSWKKRLTEQEISQVVDYIRAAFMKVTDRDTVFGDVMGAGQDKSDSFLSGGEFDETALAQATRARNNATIETQPDAINDPFLTSSAYDSQEDPNIGETDIYGGAAHDHAAHMGKKGSLSDPFPEELVGDYQQGRTFYRNNCADCHGLQGDGKGPRSHFIFPKPRNFTHSAAQASFSRAHLYEQVRSGINGSEMPAWGTVLDKQQIADVAEYVFMTFITEQRPESDTGEK